MTAATTSEPSDEVDTDILEEFLIDAQLQGLTDRTIANYESYLKDFIGWLDDDVREVGREELRGYLSHLTHEREARDGSTGLTPSTLNSYFSALNTFYSFLSYEEYVPGNPVPPFRQRYLDSGRVEPESQRQLISVEDMSMLVHSILNVRDRAIVSLFAKTGI